MKTIITLFFTVLSFAIAAQNYHLIETYDFNSNDTFPNKIFVLETKPNSLFMFKSIYNENPIGDEPYMKYFLYESINGEAFQQIQIPTVEFIISSGAAASWGVIFSAVAEDKGTELVFFDGFEAQVFDLMPDELSSIPYCGVKNDRLFFSRFMDENYSITSLFEFNSVGEMEQISNLEYGDFCDLKMINADTIVYSVVKLDGVDLNKAIRSNNQWNATQIWTNSIQVMLSDVVQLDDKLLFYEIDFGTDPSSGTYKVIVLEGNNESILFQETGDLFENLFTSKIFKHDDIVYFQIASDGSLFSTLNGTSYSTELTPSDGNLLRYFIKEDLLYFLVSKVVSGFTHDQLMKLENNQIETVYSGNSLSYLDGRLDDFFLIEYNFDSTDVPALLKVSPDGAINHWLFGTTNEPLYLDPRYAFSNAAIYQGDLHFMYGEILPSSELDFSIYALKETANLSNLNSTNFMFYPNPINNGQSITLVTEHFGEYKILNAYGAEIQTGNINANQQSIELQKLSSGIYFFNFNNSMRKFVVN